jgi:hypothetical protein
MNTGRTESTSMAHGEPMEYREHMESTGRMHEENAESTWNTGNVNGECMGNIENTQREHGKHMESTWRVREDNVESTRGAHGEY